MRNASFCTELGLACSVRCIHFDVYTQTMGGEQILNFREVDQDGKLIKLSAAFPSKAEDDVEKMMAGK
jgi:hypothetical protein